MSEPTTPRSISPFGSLADDVAAQRRAALRALHVLEYALTAPAPRRQRTWMHRVSVAIDALDVVLRERLPATQHSLDLFDEIALSNPTYVDRVQNLRQELLDLTIAVASLREQTEPDPTIEVDPDAIRHRLSVVTRQFREHQAHEADLVDEATGIDLDGDR
ncbi:MAG: hypothetical protein JWM34_4809 [Ilumatobacteraceae bacterium]|nr:hypothetical protein [Ilumatobacteraceae bacterium]